MRIYRYLSGFMGLMLWGGLVLPILASARPADPAVVNKVIAPAVETEAHTVRIVQVADGLFHPWAITFLPDGAMLVTERPGNLWLIDGDQINPVNGLPTIYAQEDQLTAPQGGSQGGLLDIALHPDFKNNGWIYFTYSAPGDPDAVVPNLRRLSGFEDARNLRGTGTALARARLNETRTRLVDLEVLYSQEPRSAPGRHYGSRIVFPGDGTVLFSIGDNGVRYVSQDLTHPAGSVIRILENGGIPSDNPLVGQPPGNLRPEIFSFGHRNNQGLAIDPATGFIWATDHGPQGGDLFYRVQKGHNYGWPQVAFGREYSTGAQIGVGRSAPGVTPPNLVWESSQAPSGLTFYSGDRFPNWRGHAFSGKLLTRQIHRIALDGDSVIGEEILFSGKMGRVREVRECPQGFLYVLTDEGNAGLFRIEPAGEEDA